jgi:hypothetical protein
MAIEGGCLCGRIRYRAEAAPIRVSHCHCDMCRRATGAVAATLACFERAVVSWQGQPARYESSDIAYREFCPDCGGTLTFNFREQPEQVYIAVGSLDDPGRFPAERHSWLDDKIAWLHLDDHLPGSQRWRKPPKGG